MIFELEDNDKLVGAWCRVFVLSVPQCALDFLVGEVVPILLPKTAITEKYSNRILSGEMLLEIWSVYGEVAFEKESKLMSLAFSLGGDIINWKIRKMAANRFKRIILNSKFYFKEKPEFYAAVLEKLQDLLCDEENFVKIDAFETVLRCLRFFRKEDFEAKFAPLIQEILEKEVLEHEELFYAMARFWGELLHELKANNLEDTLEDLIIQFYQSLFESDHAELRKWAAYNLPFFFKELYTKEESESTESVEEEFKAPIPKATWQKYVKKLVHDEAVETRAIVAAGFGEIWGKVMEVDESLGPFKRLLFDLMQEDDEQIMTSVVENLESYIKMFENESGVEQWEDVEVVPDELEESKSQDKTPKGIWDENDYVFRENKIPKPPNP